MAHGNDPWSLGSIDAIKIPGQPLILGIGLVVVVVAMHSTKWSTISHVGLVSRGQCLVALDVPCEGPLRTTGIIGFAVDGDKVSKTVVEGVPEIANTASFGSRHTETVLVGSEVSVVVSELTAMEMNTHLCEGGQL